MSFFFIAYTPLGWIEGKDRGQRSLTPDCRSMPRMVPFFRFFTGCGTVTFPGFTGCLKWWWSPLIFTRYHPSFLSLFMTSVDDNGIWYPSLQLHYNTY